MISNIPIMLLAGIVALSAVTASAHHPPLGKFDDGDPIELSGIVTKVDWRNPHVHVFMNVNGEEGVVNWAVELESPVLLRASGWHDDTLKPGDAIAVVGPRVRNGTRQLWGDRVIQSNTGRQVYALAEHRPALPITARPTPRWPDGQPALGVEPGSSVAGYWGFPSATALAEEGADVALDSHGMLLDIEDAAKVAPLQPWALALYQRRQQRQLQDDPMYLHCKPPGGPRQFQSRLGFQLLEDRGTERVFVLIGSGNRNYRILYLDGRDPLGQVSGDDDNPLYYGRSVGAWDGDTLVVNVSGFNEDFWFSKGGLPHTSLLEMEERFTRIDYDTLEYEVTINDPGAYTRPWKASWSMQWVGGEELPFHLCQHNRP